jgi:hypothetical protein
MPGYNFRHDPDGRFRPTAAEGGSLGDSTVVVTNAPDINAAGQALNEGGAVPSPNGRWTVAYAALTAAIAGGTRAVVTPY